MKEAATSPGIGTAMPDAGSTTTIGIGGATGISESAIMVEGGGDTIIADAYGVAGHGAMPGWKVRQEPG